MRKGIGLRPLCPSYSMRSIGSPGTSVMLNAQSIRAMVSQISRSATTTPGQMRRLEKATYVSWVAIEEVDEGENGGVVIYPAPKVQ